MARKISDTLNVASQALDQLGVFNAFVDIDSKFHIDPHLLKSTTIPELSGSYSRFQSHFEEVIRLLDASKNETDRMFREAVKRLKFHEVGMIGLGYSRGSVEGSGIGRKLSHRLAQTALEIVKAGIKDPIIFELAGLLEEGIGADRISDMTASIILPDVLKFSERVAKGLKLKTKTYRINESTYAIPYSRESERQIILIPKDILRHLPTASDWSDIDYVCAHNSLLRNRVNKIIGKTWKRAIRKVSKKTLLRVLLENPDVMKDLVGQYQKKPAKPYDFARDPEGEVIWHDIGLNFAKQYPLSLKTYGTAKAENILAIVNTICERFKILVETNGLFKVFYNNKGDLRHERFAQLLLYAIADSYCDANNLDLSREPNTGMGSVDFKISKGYHARVTVEVKYSTNSQLVHGYTTQLPTYNRAERTEHSIYLIIQTHKSTKVIKRLLQLRAAELNKGRRVPEVIVVDGRFRSSASKIHSEGL